MTALPTQLDALHHNALVHSHWSQICRLSHHSGTRKWKVVPAQRARSAHCALLVRRSEEIERRFEILGIEGRRRLECNREEPLHVGTTKTIEPPVALG